MRPDRWHVVVLTRVVSPLHGPGGLERHVADLVRHLRRAGVRVTLVTSPPRHQIQDPHGAEAPVAVTFVPYVTFPFAGRRGTTVLDRSTAYPLFGWRAGRLAAALVRNGGVQLVHAHGASALGYARARARDRLGTVPLVLNPQGLEEFGPPDGRGVSLKTLAYRPLQWAVRASARAADRVIATDTSLVGMVVGRLGIPRERVRVIPNAIDLLEIDRGTDPRAGLERRRRLGAGPDDVILLSVGRLERNKGFDVLAEALAHLQHAATAQGTALLGSEWRWVLVGDGPFRPMLDRFITTAGLRAHVHLTGRVEEAALHEWYEAADLFVHPTRYEGSSLVTLEAMAHRRPVVATTAGGLPDKVRPGVNGWLVSPGRADQLQQALREALATRDRWPAMGEASRAIVEREFAWSRVLGQWLELYGEILIGRPT